MDTSAALAARPLAAPVTPLPRVAARGKFFFRGGEKFFLKCVSYGPFAPDAHGVQFPPADRVRQDFERIRQLGGNAVRTFTPPPVWLLDLAVEYGLVVVAGLAWTQHVCFLDDRKLAAQIRESVRTSAEALRGHPGIFCVLVGNEIPADVVRWHGAGRVSAFLEELYGIVKSVDAEVLVSYANYPPTEYLDLDFLDFLSFNVYLHRENDFRRYVSRLQNLAALRPLVLTEFGIDSIREGESGQAAILARQVRAAFESGVAGVSIFAWTDEWFTGGCQIDDWAFGLVDRERRPKPAFHAVRQLFDSPLPPPLPDPPRISVVVCAFNAERTMDDCLRSMDGLRYPNFEVIVVNDGSTDGTLAICRRYADRIRILSQENKGLSAARNAGMDAATGDIVAYTDSDCVVDPDWLTYLAYRFVQDGFVAVGGPNLPPPEDARTAACVAASPGGPTHVLLDDEVAEHIPGCNMAFRKEVMREVGGFDPVFRAAGDDVDFCWRLQNQGYVIGFSPAAMVWHYRRNTVKAYLKQQMGYGKAEAQLYFKHPYRFNLLGQSKWLGRIYGDLAHSLFSRRPVIYYGTFGRGLFQTMYEAPSSVLQFLPFTLEWNLVGFVLLLGSFAAGRYEVIGALPLVVSLTAATATAFRARVDKKYDSFGGRLLIAALTYLGPLARSMQRHLWRLYGMTEVERVRYVEPSQKPRIRWLRRRFLLSYWSEEGREKEDLLREVMNFLYPRKYLISVDHGWNDWDIEVDRGIWSRVNLTVTVENHGGNRRLFRLRSDVRLSFAARVLLAAFTGLVAVAALAGLPEIVLVAGLLGILIALWVFREAFGVGRALFRAIDIVAQQRLGLRAAEGR